MAVENVCPGCGHRACGDEPLSIGVFRCGECGAQIAFGTLIPRVTLTPSEDGRLFALRVELGASVSEHMLDAWTLGKLVTDAIIHLPRHEP